MYNHPCRYIGVPAARFVYTNQPVYFTLEPALLAPLSLRLLEPYIIRMRIRFVNLKSCGTTNWAIGGSGSSSSGSLGVNSTTGAPTSYFNTNTTGDATQSSTQWVSGASEVTDLLFTDERVVTMARQLREALTPEGRTDMWGELAFIAPDHKSHDPRLYLLQASGDGQDALIRHQVSSSNMCV
jgi:hypothetical protein